MLGFVLYSGKTNVEYFDTLSKHTDVASPDTMYYDENRNPFRFLVYNYDYCCVFRIIQNT